MLWLSPWAGSYYFSLAMWPVVALVGVLVQANDGTRRSPFVSFALLFWIAAMLSLASQTLRALGISMTATLVLLIAVTWSMRQQFAPPRPSG
jgi:hypothetical protein